MGILYSPTGEPRLIPDAEELGFLRQGYRRNPPHSGGREGKAIEPVTPSAPPESTATEIVNVNTASLKELTALPLVGTSTAKKIQQQRPYQAVEDLIKAVPDVDWVAIESKIGF
ncbi:ComEA family DNA-binding protein [Pantanalinema sp. GBBB05]|uniref:ComEA family DNA-binding protein n=1 Tax=Pantanalinema sp. GBBB05 TaxID=2604139 RepID=UPI001D7D657D|nr:hypothetical protein [Pantanalinema sp. GBBB05]